MVGQFFLARSQRGRVMNPKNSLNSDFTQNMYLPKSRFTEMLTEENALDQRGFESWLFCHGMLFDSPDKWWGDHGRRDFPHEGIDLCLYRDRSSKICRLDEKTRIPVMHDGVIKAVIKDFLGQAIIIEHGNFDSDAGGFISFYANIKPHVDIETGTILKAGDIIATLADTSHSKANIIPHLHFSLGRLAKSFSYDRFVWNIIREPDKIILFDPLPVIDWSYRALDAGESICREL